MANRKFVKARADRTGFYGGRRIKPNLGKMSEFFVKAEDVPKTAEQRKRSWFTVLDTPKAKGGDAEKAAAEAVAQNRAAEQGKDDVSDLV